MFDHFFVQNEKTRELLSSLQIQNASVTGDNRFDRVVANANQIKENELIRNFKGSDPIFIIGSSWPVDDKILIPFVNSIEWKVIIAPHQISEGYINSIEEQISRKCVRYTQMDQHSSTNEILILDTIGQLSSAYAYGNIAYVGGGFTGKLHNILEPAVFGLPIFIGPNHKRFPEASAFISAGVAFEVRSIEDLRDKFQTVAMQRNEIQSKARELVAANTGASKRIIELLTASSTV
jgi:3-deoxy-D-manno-octulosonic-acid transferase